MQPAPPVTRSVVRLISSPIPLRQRRPPLRSARRGNDSRPRSRPRLCAPRPATSHSGTIRRGRRGWRSRQCMRSRVPPAPHRLHSLRPFVVAAAHRPICSRAGARSPPARARRGEPAEAGARPRITTGTDPSSPTQSLRPQRDSRPRGGSLKRPRLNQGFILRDPLRNSHPRRPSACVHRGPLAGRPPRRRCHLPTVANVTPGRPCHP